MVAGKSEERGWSHVGETRICQEKKQIRKRSGGNMRKRGNRVCGRREQKELKGPRIQNSFSVIEQMFERRTSGSRESVVGTTVLLLLLLLLSFFVFGF